MGFFGGIFRALGFESDSKSKKMKNKPKASYKLKEENNRPNQINGVPVYYPENIEQAKEFLLFIKQRKVIILSFDYVDIDKFEDYLDGFICGTNAKKIILDDEKLYLIVPEGIKIEE